MTAATDSNLEVCLETDPGKYRHLRFEVDGSIATVYIDIQEDQGMRPGYALKLNSYDLGVDIELADVVQRLRFEHPQVSAVMITSSQAGVFSSGANIFMLGASTHAFKVNFCKYTNETRLYIEDATENSGQTWIAGLNGIASGGGYELPLACAEIYLIDDRKSAVALPEIPYLGVLPGTGGLTRVVDKRKVRPDRADVFCTLAEGIKGERAVEWGLVDGIFPSSRFDEEMENRLRQIAGDGHPQRKGVTLDGLNPEVREDGVSYRHLQLKLDKTQRVATIELTVPDELPDLPKTPSELGADWFALRAFRELDDAILRLRFNHSEIGLILLRTGGSRESMFKLDNQLDSNREDWFVNEVIHFMKRVFKRIDCTARSFFALIDQGSNFTGSLFELALAADRTFMLDEDGVQVELTAMNGGSFPMANGLTRLQTRFLSDPDFADSVAAERGALDTGRADELGLVTMAADDIDWDDEVRLAIEERASLSPDSLTGMEANLRFPGPETMETKIFGRLSAWQNWIFQRPNAVGERGALTLYGQPTNPEFDYNRT